MITVDEVWHDATRERVYQELTPCAFCGHKVTCNTHKTMDNSQKINIHCKTDAKLGIENLILLVAYNSTRIPFNEDSIERQAWRLSCCLQH